MQVRTAVAADVPAIVALLEQKRIQLQAWAPRFWRRAENAAAMSEAHFSAMIVDPAASILVCDNGETLLGCLHFRASFVPPVYAPGGTTWMVDDFVVLNEDWAGAGEALLQDLYARTIHQGPGQLVFPVPVKDAAAQAFFTQNGLSAATTWYTISD